MRLTLLIHIIAGGLSLAAGYVALYAAKGGTLHRKSGILFVYAMLVMCSFGVVLAIAHGAWAEVNISAAILTAYLVITALLTVRRPTLTPRWIDPALMLVALAVGLTCLAFGIEAIASGTGKRNGIPAFPFFLFGVVGTLGGVLDIRMMRAGGLKGARRIARHLWRMSFALFIAAMSFFIGQADTFPKAIRIRPLLALPVLAVLVTMFYWLWRVRSRRSDRAAALAMPAAEGVQ